MGTVKPLLEAFNELVSQICIYCQDTGNWELAIKLANLYDELESKLLQEDKD